MSIARLLEIISNEADGYTAELVTATGAETKTVMTGKGKLARVIVLTDVITVTPKDNATAIGAALEDEDAYWIGDYTKSPVKFDTSLKLAFSDTGSAWVIYKAAV